MKNIKIIMLLLVIGSLLCAYPFINTFHKNEQTDGSTTKKIDFKLNDLRGISHSLSDYQGKKVYIKYWASWCPICLAGMDEFEELVNSNAGSSDVVILSIVSPGAFGEKTKEEFTKWYKERGYKVPVLFDEGGALAKELGVRAFPTSVYIDRKGKVIAVNPGQVSNSSITEKLVSF